MIRKHFSIDDTRRLWTQLCIQYWDHNLDGSLKGNTVLVEAIKL